MYTGLCVQEFPHRKPACGCGLSTALTGSCACNKCSAIKYKNSRIISHLLSVALNFWLKRLGIANSTEGKATGRLGWDGKLFPRQVLILGQLPKTVMCTCKKVVNFGAWPTTAFTASINPDSLLMIQMLQHIWQSSNTTEKQRGSTLVCIQMYSDWPPFLPAAFLLLWSTGKVTRMKEKDVKWALAC